MVGWLITRHFMSEAGLWLRKILPPLAPLPLSPCGVMQDRNERMRGDVHDDRWTVPTTSTSKVAFNGRTATVVSAGHCCDRVESQAAWPIENREEFP